MQLNRFDLNLLIALDALLQEKNVTRAAERVFVSQPAMSAALQKLRDYFNDPLLVRVGREMELTPRGLSLVEPVREALLRIQATLGTQPTFDPMTVKRSFTVALPDSTVPRLMPGVMKRLLRDAPGVQCHVEPITHVSLSRLEYGDIDLCLVSDNFRFFGLRAWPEATRYVELNPVRWVCMVDRDHPEVRDELTLEHFLHLPHVYARVAGDEAAAEDVARRLLTVDIDIRATAQSQMQLPFMLPGTILIATVPERIATLVAPILPLKFFPVPLNLPEYREILLWHKRNEPDPGHAWLREMFIELAREP